MRRRPEGLRSVLLVGAFLALVAAPGLARAEAPGPDDPLERERTEVYRQGVVFAEAGRWGEALERFQRVVAIRSAPRALMALAAAEEHVGRLVSAKRTYGKSRDDARDERDEALVAKAEAALAALEGRLPRLALLLAPGVEGAEARLDGAALEISAQGVEVDPGVYHLVVSAAGRPSFDERVVIAVGQRKEITVELGAAAAPPTPLQAMLPPAPPPRAHRGPSVGAWVLAGAGVAAAAVGLVVRLQGRTAYDDGKRTGDLPSGNAGRDRMILGTTVSCVGLGALAGAALWWTVTF